MRLSHIAASGLLLIGSGLLAQTSSRQYGPSQIWWDANSPFNLPWEEEYDNPDGLVGVLNSHMIKTEGHAFFEALGTNSRACITCHQPSNAMSISTATLLGRWKETNGKDPVFAAFDGSNCPTLPQDKQSSHSLLLERGVFRIPLAWPPPGIKPEFKLEVISDPTGCNKDTGTISVYRRPRIVGNLKYISTFMTDGREATLESQATSAIMGHEQAQTKPTAEQLRQIVEFERQIFVAQSADIRAGLLTDADAPALLGPENLAQGKALMLNASFKTWANPTDQRVHDIQKDFRQSAARGSAVFAKQCGSCHNEAKASQAMNIGTTAVSKGSGLPVFRITCDTKVIETHDPGRALITGKCADVGAIVMQQLRGLAARAPYFSNGSAKSLAEVVDFYERQYHMGLTPAEKQDLINFLKVL
jgi:cytochrome c peroxidase